MGPTCNAVLHWNEELQVFEYPGIAKRYGTLWAALADRFGPNFRRGMDLHIYLEPEKRYRPIQRPDGKLLCPGCGRQLGPIPGPYSPASGNWVCVWESCGTLLHEGTPAPWPEKIAG